MNTKFACNKNNLSEVDTVDGLKHLINKDIAREVISKLKNGKTPGQSGCVKYSNISRWSKNRHGNSPDKPDATKKRI